MTHHATANVGRGRPTAQLAAYGRVRDAVGRGMTGWQEVGEGDGRGVDEPAALRKAFPRPRWRTAAVASRCPITWDRLLWACLDAERIRVIDGIPGVSPARWVVVVRLQHRFTGRRLTRINTHTVAGAWNGRWDREERRRRKGWRQHWTALCEIVAAEAGPDVDVVLSLDANRQRPALPIHELHPRAVLAGRTHTDHLIAIPAPGRRVVVDQVRTLPLGVDFHAGLIARIRFPHKESR